MRTSYFVLLATTLLVLSWGGTARAVASAELYSSESYHYGRVEARIRFAPGSGVVSSFFLWKDGSELAGTFWNELDIEKVEADCHLELSAIYGEPQRTYNEKAMAEASWCDEYHTYAYEWTPDYIAWFVDGVELRRDAGATAAAFSENASEGMQIRFNIWPGDAGFGGTFDPASLPVYQFIDWVKYSSYQDGEFSLEWREDFDDTKVPTGWLLGSWSSPKNKSIHSVQNVGIVDGYAVLGLTADDALGVETAQPEGPPVEVILTSGTPPGNDYGDGPGWGCRVSPQPPSGALASTLFAGLMALGSCRYQRRRARSTRDRPEHLA